MIESGSGRRGPRRARSHAWTTPVLAAKLLVACRRAVLPLATLAVPAWAGPPFDTDDPEPTELHHWEVHVFGAGAGGQHAFAGSAGLDINYGAAPGLQLTATLPADFGFGPGTSNGIGDVELGAKYRFYATDDGLSVAAFPRVILPSSGRRGSGKTAVLLPIWAQRDIGR